MTFKTVSQRLLCAAVDMSCPDALWDRGFSARPGARWDCGAARCTPGVVVPSRGVWGGPCGGPGRAEGSRILREHREAPGRCCRPERGGMERPGAAAVPPRAVRGSPRAAASRPGAVLPLGFDPRPAGIIYFLYFVIKIFNVLLQQCYFRRLVLELHQAAPRSSSGSPSVAKQSFHVFKVLIYLN